MLALRAVPVLPASANAGLDEARSTDGSRFGRSPAPPMCLQAQLADIVAGEHDGEQTGGWRGSRAVGWARLWASTAAAMAFRRDIARVFLGWAKAAHRQARAQASPWQEIPSCETGLSWGRLAIVRFTVSRPTDRMFMARPHRRALAFLGFWVRQLLAAHRESARWSISLHYRIASLQGWIAEIFGTCVARRGGLEHPPRTRFF